MYKNTKNVYSIVVSDIKDQKNIQKSRFCTKNVYFRCRIRCHRSKKYTEIEVFHEKCIFRSPYPVSKIKKNIQKSRYFMKNVYFRCRIRCHRSKNIQKSRFCTKNIYFQYFMIGITDNNLIFGII